jgi:hypothetical protein
MLKSLLFPAMLRKLFCGKSSKNYEKHDCPIKFEQHLNRVAGPNICVSFSDESFEISYKEKYVVNGFGTIFCGRFQRIKNKKLITGKFTYPLIAKIFIGVIIVSPSFLLFSSDSIILGIFSWYLVIHAAGVIVLIMDQSNSKRENMITSYLNSNTSEQA